MAVNQTFPPTAFSAPGPVTRETSITELKTALGRLETMRPNVNNCNCAPSNCCQSCQTCQSTACQTCQSLKDCDCNCNCDCNSNQA